MKIPGFTAEASLHKRIDNFYTIGIRATIINNREVLPQWCYSPQRGIRCCWIPYSGWYCRRISQTHTNEYPQD